MEMNESIEEWTIGNTKFHRSTDLLSSPHRYRIHCQCRRNELCIGEFRRDKNHKLLSMVLLRLLVDGTAIANEERDEMEARQVIDCAIASVVLMDK